MLLYVGLPVIVSAAPARLVLRYSQYFTLGAVLPLLSCQPALMMCVSILQFIHTTWLDGNATWSMRARYVEFVVTVPSLVSWQL